jgi:hypothetical protein
MEEKQGVPFYIQSMNGHDEKIVPGPEVKQEIKTLLNDGNWVDVEKKDGTREMLTKPSDADNVLKKIEEDADAEPTGEDTDEEPDTAAPEQVTQVTEKPKEDEAWKNAFGASKPTIPTSSSANIKSVQATKPMKGG